MKKKFIARCTPSLGMVSTWWTQAVENMMWPMNYGCIRLFMHDDGNEGRGGEIAEARNKLVAKVLSLESDSREISHIMWLDDDVICMRGIVVQLLSHRRPIASGVYFTKCPGSLSEPLMFPGEGCGTDEFIPDRAYEIWGHGMGLTLVETNVYKRMRDELSLPLDKYGNPEWYRTTFRRPEDATIDDGVVNLGSTEDLYFLNQATKLGFSGFIDTHVAAFGFHFDKASKEGYPEKQWKEFVKEHTVTWNTSTGQVVWR